MASARLVLLLVTILYLSSYATAQECEFTDSDVSECDNSLFAPISINVNGKEVDVEITVKKDLPDDVMMHAIIVISENTMYNESLTMCDAVEDEAFGKDFLKSVEPEGTLSEGCPILEGTYRINAYSVDENKLSGIPEGPISISLRMYQDSMTLCSVNLYANISN